MVFQAIRTFSFIRELQSIAVKQIAFEYRLNTFEHDVFKIVLRRFLSFFVHEFDAFLSAWIKKVI